MGDTRSWAAEKEDETKTCKYGKVRKYFDKCTCDGCRVEKAESDRLEQLIKDFSYDLKIKLKDMHPSTWEKQLEERLNIECK
mgnify:CR=1 FL=1